MILLKINVPKELTTQYEMISHHRDDQNRFVPNVWINKEIKHYNLKPIKYN